MLGLISMYSLGGEAKATYSDLVVEFRSNGLPTTVLPNPLSDIGAFRRATTAMRKMLCNDKPVVVKELRGKNDEIIREFEIGLPLSNDEKADVLDGKEIIPVYKHILTMILEKNVLDYHVYAPEGDVIREAVLKKFREDRNCYNVEQIRVLLQNVLKKFGSLKLRGNGGVNFIPEQYRDSFVKFSSIMNKIEGVEIISYEIDDTQVNQNSLRVACNEYVAKSLEDEVKSLGKTLGSKELKEMLADFSKVIAEGQKQKALSHTTIANICKRFSYVTSMVRGYQKMIETELDVTEDEMKIAKEQLNKILEMVA